MRGDRGYSGRMTARATIGRLALLTLAGGLLLALFVPALRAGATGDGRALSTADTTPPETRILSGPPKTIWTSPSRFRLGSSEAGSRFSCNLDDEGWRPCPARAAFRVETGWHTLKVRARDAAGNVDRTPARRVWRFQPRVG